MADRIRSGNYTVLRSVEIPKRHLFEKVEWLPEMDIDGYRVPDNSHLAGRSIAELQIRRKTGVTVVAVRRGPEVFTNPGTDFEFRAGDIILFTGNRESMHNAADYFRDGMPV